MKFIDFALESCCFCGTIAADSVEQKLLLSTVNNTMIPFESSAAAVGYGNLGQVCHNFAAAGGVNSCFPAL